MQNVNELNNSGDLEKFFKNFDQSLVLRAENKLFGVLGARNETSFLLSNLVIQVAQRCIWYARRKFEESALEVDLLVPLRNRLRILIKRAQITQKHRFDEIFVRSTFLKFFNEL